MNKGLFLILTFLCAQNVYAQDCDKYDPDYVKIEKCGYREKYNGKWAIKPQFSNCYEFLNGVAKVGIIDKRARYYGYIDCSGNFIVPPKYHSAEQEPVNGYSIVSYDNTSLFGDFDHSTGGVIHVKTNTIIVPLEFDRVERVGNAYNVYSKQKNKYLAYDNRGNIIGTSCEYYQDGYHVAKNEGKVDVYDADLNFIFSIKATKLGPGESNLFKSIKNVNLFNSTGQTSYLYDGKIGVVDKKGNIIKDATAENEKYDYISTGAEGRKLVRKNGKYGFINEVGELITPLDFDFAQDFKEGLAVVSKNGKYGFIDNNGTIVIPMNYTNAYPFSKGEAWVEMGTNTYYINKNGVVVRDMQEKPKEKAKKCLQSCTNCGGTGTRMLSSASQCSYCSGTGKSGSATYTIGGHTQVESKACGICGGSGRGFGSNTTFEYCKTCNQTGCLKFE